MMKSGNGLAYKQAKLQYHGKLRFPDKGRAIKGLVGKNSQEIICLKKYLFQNDIAYKRKQNTIII